MLMQQLCDVGPFADAARGPLLMQGLFLMQDIRKFPVDVFDVTIPVDSKTISRFHVADLELEFADCIVPLFRVHSMCVEIATGLNVAKHYVVLKHALRETNGDVDAQIPGVHPGPQ